MSSKAELVEQAEALDIDVPEGATKAEIQELIDAVQPPTEETPVVDEDVVSVEDTGPIDAPYPIEVTQNQDFEATLKSINDQFADRTKGE